jgi:hypothetical protein
MDHLFFKYILRVIFDTVLLEEQQKLLLKRPLLMMLALILDIRLHGSNL